jgi:dolichol-phosphate mannosyltransferase
LVVRLSTKPLFSQILFPQGTAYPFDRIPFVIIMPVYNEGEGLLHHLQEWIQLAQSYQAIICLINDGSKDDSWIILNQLYQQYPQTIMLIDKANAGHGQTCLQAYLYFTQTNIPWIFQTDSDGQTQASDFPALWKNRHTHHFHFGHRLHRQDGMGRIWISFFLKLTFNVLFLSYIPDSNVPFRLMSSKSLASFLPQIPFQLYLSNAYLTHLIQCHYTIRWYPIFFQARSSGEASVRSLKFFKVGLKVLQEFYSLRDNHDKPYDIIPQENKQG